MSWVHEVIRERGGAIPFRDFMELALYHPVHGYYRAGPVRFGRDGDFLTAPTASGWYARTVAHLVAGFAEDRERWTVVDLAAGEGSFLAELLEAAPAAVDRVVAVERSATLGARITERLAGSAVPVEVRAELGEVGDGPALLHASELYDALPVHRVVRRGDEIRELWVRADDGGLEWLEEPAPGELLGYLDRHGAVLVDGQVAEISLGAGALHRAVLGAVRAFGVAIVLDYGYDARRLYDPRGRREGSLVAHVRHRVSRDVLADPGERDLTAHVNLDDLRSAAAAAGWIEVGCWPLAELMVRAGLGEVMERAGIGPEAEWDAAVIADRQEVKRLLDPDGMGSDLRALVQATPALAPRVDRALSLR